MKSLYGISLREFEAMVEEQKGCCFLCEQPPPEGTVLQMDHCHRSGVHRRPLCTNCNTALGRFNDDVGLMVRAIAYIEKYAA